MISQASTNGTEERRLSSWLLWSVVTVTVVASVLFNGTITYGVWLDPTGLASFGWSLLAVLGLMGLLLFLSAVALILLCVKRLRRSAWIFISSIVICLILTWSFGRINGPLRDQQYQTLFWNNDRLVRAISEYEQANGRPPERINDLLPSHLNGVPKTVGPASVRYNYFAGERVPDEFSTYPWVLQAIIDEAPFDYAFFIFLPDQTTSPNSGKWIETRPVHWD